MGSKRLNTIPIGYRPVVLHHSTMNDEPCNWYLRDNQFVG